MNGILSFSDYNFDMGKTTLIKLWYDPQLAKDDKNWIVAISFQEFEDDKDIGDQKLTEREDKYKSVYFDTDDIILLRNYCDAIIKAEERTK